MPQLSFKPLADGDTDSENDLPQQQDYESLAGGMVTGGL